MKAKNYLIVILITGFSFSCKDYLEQQSVSTLDSETVYSNYGYAVSAVDGILNPMGYNKSYRNRLIPWYGMNTDIEWCNNSSGTSDKYSLCTYKCTSSNSQMDASGSDPYTYAYKGIEQANLAIEGLREYADIENDEEMAYLLGRALTYRAVYYADLLKCYGDVPARFSPVTSETIYLAKSSRDDIYIQLLADLKEAEDYVPWSNQNSLATTSEDINKAFVKGLRARLAMNAGGYSAYPSSLTEETDDYEVRRSTNEELDHSTMMTLALSECEDIIAQEGTYVDLDDDFEDIFERNCAADLTAGSESLWEIPFKTGRGQLLKYFAIKHNNSDQYVSKASEGGTHGPLPFVFYDYDEDDLRRDVTCIPYYWGDLDDDGNAKQELYESDDSKASVSTWYFGKYRYEWMTEELSGDDDGVNKIYMRYAEVLLIASEASYELGDLDAAKTYLKEVRSRAFSDEDQEDKVDEYVNDLTDDTFFDALVDEYGFEFCGETIRKECLIRWNLLDSKIEEAREKMDDLRNLTGDYADVPSTLYYDWEDDGETLKIYGLNRGETLDKSSEYGNVYEDWIKASKIDDDDIEALSYADDINSRMFWPIWQTEIDGSNGYLVNSYGY